MNSLLKYLYKFFDTLDSWIDDLEYKLGNFIDPPKEHFADGDNTDKWCEKITARQAFRYAKYMRKKWNNTRAITDKADLSEYKLKKDRDVLRKFIDSVNTVADYHEDLYRRMYRRKLAED